MTNESITLAFVGDIMLGRHIDKQIGAKQPCEFWGDTLSVLCSADAVIGNLECPITSHPHPWRRTMKTFRFRARPQAVELLEAANVRLVNLANNHMLDYQEEGLFDTIAYLGKAGISHAGAGNDAYEAAKPAFIEAAGVKIGMIGFTDRMPEWRAGHQAPGINYVKLKNDNVTLNMVRCLIADARRKGADIVVVSYHWGPNLRTSPPRHFRDFARRVIELGADVFHGHSAHLFQGVELHRGGVILFDTGNILDDLWIFPGIRTDNSLIFNVEFQNGRFKRLQTVPVVQDRTSVRLAKGEDFETIRAQMIRRCLPFSTHATRCADGLEIVALPDPAERHWNSRHIKVGGLIGSTQ
jgi:poly-gamma-glutamate synthesis protein (capsule biosynthesis protein)